MTPAGSCGTTNWHLNRIIGWRLPWKGQGVKPRPLFTFAVHALYGRCVPPALGTGQGTQVHGVNLSKYPGPSQVVWRMPSKSLVEYGASAPPREAPGFSRGEHHPLNPVITIPRMNRRCAKKNINMTETIDTVLTAMSQCHAPPSSLRKYCRPN